MSNSDVHLSVVIPAYNEESRLPETLTQSMDFLRGQDYRSEILVVDDGSTDGTGRVANGWNGEAVEVRVVRHADRANHGKGASIKRGMLEARGAYRLLMDADNSTTLRQVTGFWPFFRQGYEVVIGSRALPESVIGVHQPRYKELAGRIGNWITRRLAVPGFYDTQAGFKMLTGKCAEEIIPLLTIDRWGYDIELLAIAGRRGYRIREVPIAWINAPGSKVRVHHYFQVLREIWKIRKNLKAGLYDRKP
jgi:glycosyltransferase involved in cell wall biosynthesis